ncbi:MAG: YggS family pyridoxal phosphate-dependent enzyme [Bacteroidales bacterium]|nr:YggS family pyridoxal phosphate-dependent enzyme [Bacteroidales bacterium]
MNIEKYNEIKSSLPDHVQLIAVSKFKPATDIQMLYDEGNRAFGENKAQEMKAKHEVLPKDIQWHFIGHLQTNKVKYIAPFVTLIHSIDSEALLQEVDKQAAKNDRVIPCLIQFHIAKEDTKFGFSLGECETMLQGEVFQNLHHVKICGVMGMATFTENMDQVRREFQKLHSIFNTLKEKYFPNNPDFKEISMGMTDDYPIAIEEGSTMIRIGSAIFGPRDYSQMLSPEI